MSASDKAIPGGHPSSTAPIAGPWLSPQVVKRKTRPNVFQLMSMFLADHPGLSRFRVTGMFVGSLVFLLAGDLPSLLDALLFPSHKPHPKHTHTRGEFADSGPCSINSTGSALWMEG